MIETKRLEVRGWCAAHTDKQYEIIQEKSSHAPYNHAKQLYIIQIYTQANREHDNKDECNKDSILKYDQDNIWARESTLRQTRYTTIWAYMSKWIG